MAEAIRDGRSLEAIAADIAGDGEPHRNRTALALLSTYDIAVLDRDVVASGSGTPILVLTAAGRLDKASGFAPTTGLPCERAQVCGWTRPAQGPTETAATSR